MSADERIEARLRRLEAKFETKPFGKRPKAHQGADQDMAVYPTPNGGVGVSVKWKGQWTEVYGPEAVEAGFGAGGGLSVLGRGAYAGPSPKPPKVLVPDEYFPVDAGREKLSDRPGGLRGDGLRGGSLFTRRPRAYRSSTEQGQGGWEWSGHAAEYVPVANTSGTDVDKGMLLVYASTGRSAPADVAARTSTSQPIAGVAMEDIADGNAGRMAIQGFVDVLTKESHGTAGTYYYGGVLAGFEAYVQLAPSDDLAGIGVIGAGLIGYETNWARIYLTVGVTTASSVGMKSGTFNFLLMGA